MTRLSVKSIVALMCAATITMSVAGCHSGEAPTPPVAATAAPPAVADSDRSAFAKGESQMRAQEAAAHRSQ